MSNYQNVDAVDSFTDSDAVSGATAEDRALAKYVHDLKTKGIAVRRSVGKIDDLIERA